METRENLGKGIGSILGMIATIATGGAAAPLVPGLTMLGSNLGKQFPKRKYGGAVEVEGGEVNIRPNGEHVNYKGPLHKDGGIKYTPAMKGEFIISNAIGYDAAGKVTLDKRQIKTYLADYVKKLRRQPGDTIAENTINMVKKDNSQVLQRLMYGGTPKKYVLGGPFDISKEDPQKLLDIVEPSLSKDGKTSFNGGPAVQKDASSLNLNTLNAIGAGLKGLGVAYNFGTGLSPYERETERQNAQASLAKRLMSSTSVSPDALYNQINLARNAAASNAGRMSAQVRSALMANIDASASQQRQQAYMQSAQQNNQYRMQEAQSRAVLGTEERQEKIRQQNVESANRAARNEILGQGFTNLSQIGTTVNDYANTEAERRFMAAALSGRYKNFTLTPEIMSKLASGQLKVADLIKFQQ